MDLNFPIFCQIEEEQAQQRAEIFCIQLYSHLSRALDLGLIWVRFCQAEGVQAQQQMLEEVEEAQLAKKQIEERVAFLTQSHEVVFC